MCVNLPLPPSLKDTWDAFGCTPGHYHLGQYLHPHLALSFITFWNTVYPYKVMFTCAKNWDLVSWGDGSYSDHSTINWFFILFVYYSFHHWDIKSTRAKAFLLLHFFLRWCIFRLDSHKHSMHKACCRSHWVCRRRNQNRRKEEITAENFIDFRKKYNSHADRYKEIYSRPMHSDSNTAKTKRRKRPKRRERKCILPNRRRETFKVRNFSQSKQQVRKWGKQSFIVKRRLSVGTACSKQELRCCGRSFNCCRRATGDVQEELVQHFAPHLFAQGYVYEDVYCKLS